VVGLRSRVEERLKELSSVYQDREHLKVHRVPVNLIKSDQDTKQLERVSRLSMYHTVIDEW
jgi:hypothetical protein